MANSACSDKHSAERKMPLVQQDRDRNPTNVRASSPEILMGSQKPPGEALRHLGQSGMR